MCISYKSDSRHTEVAEPKDVMLVANYHLLVPSDEAYSGVGYWVLCYF